MITGWITNKGQILKCDTYSHFIVNDTTINNIWKPYELELEESYSFHMSLADSGEHPEWHGYEMLEDGSRHDAFNKIYKLGYLRLSKYGNDLAVEGFPQYMGQHKNLIEELSNKYNCLVKYFKITIL